MEVKAFATENLAEIWEKKQLRNVQTLALMTGNEQKFAFYWHEGLKTQSKGTGLKLFKSVKIQTKLKTKSSLVIFKLTL